VAVQNFGSRYLYLDGTCTLKSLRARVCGTHDKRDRVASASVKRQSARLRPINVVKWQISQHEEPNVATSYTSGPGKLPSVAVRRVGGNR
jgi:hypothetical protein